MIFATLAICYVAVILEILLNGNELVILIPYGILIPMAIFIPRLLQPLIRKYYQLSRGWLSLTEKLIFYLVLINIPGSIFFHRIGVQYDRFIHLSAGVLCTLILFLILLPLLKIHEFKKLHILSILFILAMSSNFLWEMWQLTSDGVFGTQLFFDLAQSIQQDFSEDVSFAAIGIIISMFYLNNKYEKLNSLIRRHA